MMKQLLQQHVAALIVAHIAYEGESYERIFVTYENKIERRFEDEAKIYWYCHYCKKATLISENKL